MTNVLVTALILVPFVGAAAQGTEGPERLIEQAASAFIDVAAQSWEDFSVCEHRSKTDDKRVFLSKRFGKELFPLSATVLWKELTVSEAGAASALHLGLIALTFQDQKEAVETHTRLTTGKEPFLRGTKILTQYKALVHNNTVLILYSETFNHKKLRDFFATITLKQ